MTDKGTLRTEARARRAECVRSVPDFAARLAAHAAALDIPRGSLVGAYVAMEGEADPRLLLERLAREECTFAFPRVAAKRAPLEFHHAQGRREFVISAFGVPEPAPDWPLAHPGILLVPLLAFDATGTRLGYGGGFYDRTLASLARNETPPANPSHRGPTRAIGIAYAGQEVASLPRDAHDQPLDMIVTEDGVRRFT